MIRITFSTDHRYMNTNTLARLQKKKQETQEKKRNEYIKKTHKNQI